MDTQFFFTAWHEFVRPFTSWPLWAIIALVTSTLHLFLINDFFESAIDWKKLPVRLAWSIVFCVLAGIVITTIDPTPTYSFLGTAITILAAINLALYVIRFCVGVKIKELRSEAKQKTEESGDGSDLVIVFGMLALAISYVAWPMFVGRVAESEYIHAAQTLVKHENGSFVQVVVLEDIVEDEATEELHLVTSAGDFRVESTREFLMLKNKLAALYGWQQDGDSPVYTRDYLYTIRWEEREDGTIRVLSIEQGM